MTNRGEIDKATSGTSHTGEELWNLDGEHDELLYRLLGGGGGGIAVEECRNLLCAGDEPVKNCGTLTERTTASYSACLAADAAELPSRSAQISSARATNPESLV